MTYNYLASQTLEDLSRALTCALYAKNKQSVRETMDAMKQKTDYSDNFVFNGIVQKQVIEAEEWLKSS